jgi:glycerol-3-phosphate acyltransferase PlsX
MRIAVDGMGGDFAPSEIVKGAVDAARTYQVDIVLVGPRDRMEAELSKHDCTGLTIEVVHTDQYLIEGEPPAFALRRKPQASVFVATKLVKDGQADAVISAGPTGGVVAAALYLLGTVSGFTRPVVGGAFLGFAPKTVVLDLGSNVDCKPEELLDFAIVGTVYAKKMLGIENPTVALLSVGAEEGKGNDQVKQAYSLFKQSGLNFIGNVEGNDIPAGKANVVICDGFVGNILVKFSEELGKVLCKWLEGKLKNDISKDKVSAMTSELLSATNVADVAGGGPLWAVNGVACVAHGRCKAPEICKTIGQAKLAVEQDWVGTLKRELALARSKLGIE